MIVIPASLRSDFIHMPGMTIHIALESTIHIVGIRSRGFNSLHGHHKHRNFNELLDIAHLLHSLNFEPNG